ncbi:hypothetical protein CLF_102408 [Clonorchis sinensis]|uniref:FTS and Hook-interacting protein n=1 Tax=Clonorchis sinensis TaxID=79923 RepID=G7Y7V4_CLOSI|nr:hypothetical protein CLF_102408 [Clonorchis sinensis]
MDIGDTEIARRYGLYTLIAATAATCGTSSVSSQHRSHHATRRPSTVDYVEPCDNQPPAEFWYNIVVHIKVHLRAICLPSGKRQLIQGHPVHHLQSICVAQQYRIKLTEKLPLVFNNAASWPYNLDLFESLIVKKGIKSNSRSGRNQARPADIDQLPTFETSSQTNRTDANINGYPVKKGPFCPIDRTPKNNAADLRHLNLRKNQMNSNGKSTVRYRQKKFSESQIRETQARFRSDRICVHRIFTLELSHSLRRSVVIVFFKPAAAFDPVHRQAPCCYTTQRKYDEWDTVRLPKPRQEKSKCIGWVVATNFLVTITPGLGATELHPIRLGQYLSAVVENRLFDKLLIWVEGKPCPGNEKAVRIRDIQRTHLLTLFEDLMTQSLQHVLYESSILRPLLQFIFKLSSQLKPAYEQSYGRTLYELCVLLCRDSSLLAVCRKLSDELFEQPHLVFTLLVPLIHRADSVGDHAKDAFLLALSLSKIDESLSSYLAFESDFCPVLAAGLGALYSSLPKKLIPRHSFRSHDAESPGGPVVVSTSAFLNPHTSTPCIVELPVGGAAWHQLSDIECNQSTDLRRFLHTLDFCNLVMKISHPSVREQLLHFISSGFLIPVLGSALHQSALDEVVAATAYLELFLRRLTDPLLLKLFLRFIVTSNHDSYPILTSLVNRLNANAALGMVTLSLFRTILSFHCEDVMYELIFKHLGPLYHLQPPQSHKVSVKENFHVKSSRLLSPSRQDTVTRTHHPPLSELALNLVRSGDNFLALATTAAPDLRHAAKISEAFSRYSLRNGESVQTPTAAYATFAAPETPFLYPYLRSAFSRIHRRVGACQAWSSKYFPLNLSGGATDTFLSDKDLEEFEIRNQQELQTTPTKLASQPFKPPASSHGSSIENHVNDDFRSSPLLSRSHVRASSLYQLNYICDLSDDDSAVNYGKPEVSVSSTDPSNLRGDIPATHSENLVDTFDSKPSNDYPVSDDEVCTCVPNPSVECLSFEDSDDDADSPLQIDELNSFLTALDHVSLPWNCSLHFSHLPSCSTLPPIDPEFLKELDIPGEPINPVLSLKPQDSLLSSEHQTLCSGVCTQGQSPTSSSTHTYTSDSSHPARNKSPIAGGIGFIASFIPDVRRLINRAISFKAGSVFSENHRHHYH